MTGAVPVSDDASRPEAGAGARPDASMPAGPWLLVVGMHRSGTSAVTGALGALGLAVPVAEDRPNAPESNPDHWESLGMGVHGDAVLEALGGTWDGPPTPSPGWEDGGSVAVERVGEPGPVARAAFPEPGPLVWKDPRTCLLLPYWRSRLPGPLAAVFTWRHPLPVARSLERRDGMHLADGVALWERYNRAALAGLSGLDVFVTDYDSVLADPLGRLGEVAEWLGGLPQFAAVSGRFDLGAAAGVVAGGLRHHGSAEDATVLLDEQRALLDHLTTLAGPHRGFDAAAPGSESAWTAAVLEDRRRAAELDLAVHAHERLLEEQRAAHATELVARQRQHDAALAAWEAETARLEAERDRVRHRLRTTEDELTAVRTSTTWRLTQPVRTVAAAAKRARERDRPGTAHPRSG